VHFALQLGIHAFFPWLDISHRFAQNSPHDFFCANAGTDPSNKIVTTTTADVRNISLPPDVKFQIAESTENAKVTRRQTPPQAASIS
jgi:hypothetical protein